MWITAEIACRYDLPFWAERISFLQLLCLFIVFEANTSCNGFGSGFLSLICNHVWKFEDSQLALSKSTMVLVIQDMKEKTIIFLALWYCGNSFLFHHEFLRRRCALYKDIVGKSVPIAIGISLRQLTKPCFCRFQVYGIFSKQWCFG